MNNNRITNPNNNKVRDCKSRTTEDQYLNGKLGFNLTKKGNLATPFAYDRRDEYEAFARQGIVGKTLTNDQIDKNQAYKNLNLYKENQQIKNYMPDIINDNKNYYNATGSPAVLYHGWKGDIKK